jgi:signal transduction histidine kinase
MARRLLASYLSLAVLVLLALEIPLAITFARGERRDLTTKVERDAVALASLAEDTLERGPGGDARPLSAIALRYSRDTGGRVVVVTADGQAVIDTAEQDGLRHFGSRPEIAEALAGRVATGVRRSETLGTSLLYVAVPVASSGVVHGAVRVTYPTSAIDARVHRYWGMLAAIGAVVLGVAALVGVRFARSIARPLGRLERAAGAAGAGDLTARAPVEGPPEVRSLARSFNEMVATLEATLRSQRAFVADASHQLRTPLAALRLRLDNLARDAPAEGREQIDATAAEVDRLSDLVDGLLALARADAGAPAQEPLDVRSAVDSRIALWSALAEERGIALRGEVVDAPAALATPGRLEQVLDNLVANALDASPPGAPVTISARPAGARVEIHVVDEGTGMSAEEREHAFDRFWRGAGSPAGGTGLGLAIVRRLVESDGGTVELAEAAGGGLDAVVRLRAAAPPGDGGARTRRGEAGSGAGAGPAAGSSAPPS